MTGTEGAQPARDVAEALAWFRQVRDIRLEVTFPEAQEHAAAIVRAALAAGPDEDRITDVINGWIKTQLDIADAAIGEPPGRGDEEAAQHRLIERLRHLDLSGVDYRLTPRLVAALAGARPAAEPGTILHAWRQIARLVGREDTSPASVVDRVAYLIEPADGQRECGCVWHGPDLALICAEHRREDLAAPRLTRCLRSAGLLDERRDDDDRGT